MAMNKPFVVVLAVALGLAIDGASRGQSLAPVVTAAGQETTRAPLPQESSGAVGAEVTLDQLQSLALANRPDLRATQARIAAALGRAQQAEFSENPVVGYVADDVGEDGEGGKHGLFIEKTIVHATKRTWRSRAYVELASELEYAAVAEQQRIAAQVGVQYYRTLAAQELVALRERLLETAHASQTMAARLKNVGQLNRPDELMTVIAARQAESDRDRARLDWESQCRDLASTVGVPDVTVQRLAGEIEAIGPEIDENQSLGEWLDSSPQVARLVQAVNVAQAAVCRERAEACPDWDVAAETAYDFGSDRTIAGVQVGVTLPLVHRNNGNISAAAAEVAISQAALDEFLLALRREHSRLFAQYASARQQAASYRTQLADATEATNMYREAADAQMVPFQRVLDSQKVFFELSASYVLALRDMHVARIQLESLVTLGLDRQSSSVDDAR